MQRLLAVGALLACLSLASGAPAAKAVHLGPSWYQCDPTKCLPTKNCQCPTVTPPGGLKPEETPQFVVLTHDDAVNGLSNKVVRMVTDGHKNPNGCNVPTTWFVLETGSNCTLTKQLWLDNHEIATHTVHHYQMYERLAQKVNFTQEIVGARDWLVDQCSIPRDSVVGFRSPYLVHNPYVREVLFKNGFLYDSSINEVFPSQTSPSKGSRLWPYTMDDGIPQNCAWTAPDGNCTRSERYPGLWEFPMWDMQSAKGDSISTMDPPGDVYSLLVENFNFNYQGNRAPLGIFLHAPWFTTENQAAAIKFIEWALAQPDVWFVTMRQLIQWMRDPVPASKMGKWLTCNKTDLKPPEVKYCQIYTVRPGDYLWLIATNYGVSPDEVLQLNPSLGDGTRIQIGATIKLPPWRAECGQGVPVNSDASASSHEGSQGSPSPSLEASGSPAGQPAAPSPSPSPRLPPPSCRTWKVKAGDFLYAIANSTGSDVADIVSLNKLKANGAIMPGQVLKIPPYPACCKSKKGCPNSSTPAPTPSSPQPGNPSPTSSRLQATFALTGVARTSWETDLKLAFQMALAHLLGVDTAAVTITGVHTVDDPAAGPAAGPEPIMASSPVPAESQPAAAAPAATPAVGSLQAPEVAPAPAETSPVPTAAPVTLPAPHSSRRLLADQHVTAPAPTSAEPAPAQTRAPGPAEEWVETGPASSTLSVEVAVSSNNPLGLYRQAVKALKSGKLRQKLSALGMILTEDPQFKVVRAKSVESPSATAPTAAR